MSSVEGWSEDKKDEKPADGRWVRPPLARFDELRRKNFAETPMRPPIPLEKLLKSEEDDDDDEEDEEKESRTDEAREAVERVEVAAEQSPEDVFETVAE